MDFTLTAEQQDLQKMVREFAEAEIRPHVMEWDEQQDFPTSILKSLGQLGVLGIVFPESLGGAEMGYIEYAIVMEELARVDPSIALSVAAHIYMHGSKALKERYVPKLATGEWIGCWSLTEPEAGSDAAGTRTRDSWAR